MGKMKRLIIFFLLAMVLLPESSAQLWKYKRFEATGFVGTSQFFGDVGGYTIGENFMGLKDISISHTRFSVGASMRYWVIEDATVKVGVSYIMLHATDKKGSNEERGFECTSSVIEPVVAGEYYFVRNKARNSYLFIRGRRTTLSFFQMIDLYGTVGLGGGIYFVNPNDILEPRVEKTKGFTAVVPVGIGASMILTPSTSAGVQLIAHYTFSDYLDGYTSQYSERNDLFYTLNFTFSYKFSLFRSRNPNGVRF
jgi:hypothetical protein